LSQKEKERITFLKEQHNIGLIYFAGRDFIHKEFQGTIMLSSKAKVGALEKEQHISPLPNHGNETASPWIKTLKNVGGGSGGDIFALWKTSRTKNAKIKYELPIL